MKRTVSVFLMCLACAGLPARVVRTETGLSATADDGTRCEITFFTPTLARVVKYPAAFAKAPRKESLSVTAAPEKVKIAWRETDGTVVMTTSGMSVTYDGESGRVSFSDLKGGSLLKEAGTAFKKRETGMDAGAYEVSQTFVLDSGEAVYGLGQTQTGELLQRNMSRYMLQANLEDAVPVLHSVKGWGLFWDNYSPTTYSDGEAGTVFSSEVGDMTDYYFMYGGNADGVIALMRHLTGRAPMLPLWTYGYWQSRERYKTQEELVEVVDKYRQLGVPLDGIIQDWQYWGNNYLWNAMDFLSTGFYDPGWMTSAVHEKNAHVIISIWSSFGPQTLPYRELSQKNMLLHFQTWPQSGLDFWPPDTRYPSGVRAYDPFNPAARDIYWSYAEKGLFARGVDGWWMDSTEPDHVEFTDADLEDSTYLGSYRSVCNAYPLMSVGGVYDHQRAAAPDKRVFILTRSAFAGQQRYGADTWTGDITSTWETLRKQIPAGLNFCLTGIPQWNTDIGGFFAGAYNNSYADGTATKNPLYQELYVRWMQFGAFCPMMRSHGTEAPREIYFFGEKGQPVYDAIEKAIRLRYSLLPYIYSTAWQVTKNDYTFFRALMMDFAGDGKTWDIGDEFMFGSSVLVAPVVKAQYTTEVAVSLDEANDGWNRENTAGAGNGAEADFTGTKTTEVYLPEGASWYDFWTNEKFSGGQNLTRETTLDLIPLYIKAGGILPLGPDVQYAEEKPWDALEIKVYPGADGTFVLYEDAFDGYGYEKGEYTEIPMTWNDKSRTLSIGARRGSYEGMITSRTFKVTLPSGQSKTVSYVGHRASVRF